MDDTISMNSINSENKVKERIRNVVYARIKQTDIAKEAGVSKMYVNMILRGTYPHRGDRSNRVREIIAKHLGKPVDEVFDIN